MYFICFGLIKSSNMKTYTEEDMKAAYVAGNYSKGHLGLAFREWIESYNTPPKPKDKEFIFSKWILNEKNISWDKWLIETGYAINNERVKSLFDNDLLICTESQARKLGLI